MPTTIRNLEQVFEDKENNLIFMKNVAIPLKNSNLPVRANVYRPFSSDGKFPVLVTYGPYGKDIYYGEYVRSRTPPPPPGAKREINRKALTVLS